MRKYLVRFWSWLLQLSAILIFTSCGSVTRGTALNARTVIDTWRQADIQIANISSQTLSPGASSSIPAGAKEHLAFDTPDTEIPGGNQIFVCDTKTQCDPIASYFVAQRAQYGPYLYRNDDGRVVVQFNPSLAPDLATRFEALLKPIR